MHRHRAPFRFTPRWWVALAAVATLLAYGLGTASADTAPAPDPVAAQYARCQADLKAKPAPAGSYLTWLNNCVKAFAPVPGSPSPSPSTSPSNTPTSTPTPVPTSASPSPSNTATPTPTTVPPTTQPPSPTPTPSPTGGDWPGPANTGVPAGLTLLPWSGCPSGGGQATISAANTHLDAVVINCDVAVRTSGVTITRSRINGSIGDGEPQNCAGCSFALDQVEVSAGAEQNPAVWHTTFTATRSNIHGGQTSVSCVQACTVKDSWLHGQVISVAGQHLGGFLSNGGGTSTTPSLIEHNTIVCDSPQVGSGSATASCSGDINLYGDFGGVRYYTLTRNLFKASIDASYCVYGGSNSAKAGTPDHIVFTDNVMEHGDFIGDPGNSGGVKACAWWGAVADWDGSRPGTVWSGNTWDDGTELKPTRSGS